MSRKFEYMVVRWDRDKDGEDTKVMIGGMPHPIHTDEQLAAALSALGEQGWEVCDLHTNMFAEPVDLMDKLKKSRNDPKALKKLMGPTIEKMTNSLFQMYLMAHVVSSFWARREKTGDPE